MVRVKDENDEIKETENNNYYCFADLSWQELEKSHNFTFNL